MLADACVYQLELYLVKWTLIYKGFDPWSYGFDDLLATQCFYEAIVDIVKTWCLQVRPCNM